MRRPCRAACAPGVDCRYHPHPKGLALPGNSRPVPAPDSSSVLSDILLGVALVVGGLALLAILAGAAALVFGFVIGPRMGRPLAYSGGVGAIEALLRALTRVLHRAEFRGLDPSALPAGGFVLVSNHGSGLDAPLMQCATRRPVRFMMAADQMHPWLTRLWTKLEVLPVHYGPEDSATVKAAVRHLKGGGIVGIFPEGGIAKQPRTIEPFAEGIGTLVALSKVPVVLLWIHGHRTVGSALVDPVVPRGKAVVELVGVFDFTAEGVRDPAEMCRRLRQALAERSGWQLVERPASAAG